MSDKVHSGLWYTTFDGKLSTPELIVRSPFHGGGVAVDERDGVAVAWLDRYNYEPTQVGFSSRQSGRWSSPTWVVIRGTTRQDVHRAWTVIGVHLVFDASGRPVLVWWNDVIAQRTDNVPPVDAAVFVTGHWHRVGVPAQVRAAEEVAMGPRNELHVVWTDSGDPAKPNWAASLQYAVLRLELDTK